MGFCVGSIATIKELVLCEKNYSTCKISIFKLNKDKKNELSFSGFARFLGEAHKNKPNAGDRILIKKCDVTNVYKSKEQIKYNKNPVFIIYDYELQGTDIIKKAYTSPISFGEDEIDFNSDGLPF